MYASAFSHFATRVHLFYLISFEFFFFLLLYHTTHLPAWLQLFWKAFAKLHIYACLYNHYMLYMYIYIYIVNALVCLQGLRGTSSNLFLFSFCFAMFVLLGYFIAFCDSRISTRTLVVIIIHIHTYVILYICICICSYE